TPRPGRRAETTLSADRNCAAVAATGNPARHSWADPEHGATVGALPGALRNRATPATQTAGSSKYPSIPWQWSSRRIDPTSWPTQSGPPCRRRRNAHGLEDSAGDRLLALARPQAAPPPNGHWHEHRSRQPAGWSS